MANSDSRVGKAIVQRVAVAGVREATKNIGKQVVKAHIRASGKVVSSYLRVAPRGAARFIPGGIGLTISVLDAAYSAYSLYSAVNDKPEEVPDIEEVPEVEDSSDDEVEDIAVEGVNDAPSAADLPDLFR
jgi:hypothetical protein